MSCSFPIVILYVSCSQTCPGCTRPNISTRGHPPEAHLFQPWPNQNLPEVTRPVENTHKSHASSQNRRRYSEPIWCGLVCEITVETSQQKGFPLNECRNESYEWISTGGRTANRLMNPKHQVTRMVPQRAMMLGMLSTSGLTQVLIDQRRVELK